MAAATVLDLGQPAVYNVEVLLPLRLSNEILLSFKCGPKESLQKPVSYLNAKLN